MKNEKERRIVAKTEAKGTVTLEQLFDSYQAGDVRELRLIIKADVQGSLEPIISSLNEISDGEIAVNILHAETGNIGENDIMLATASQAIVIGFNVQADAAAHRMADTEGVSIREYDIILPPYRRYRKCVKGHAGTRREGNCYRAC